MKRKLFSMLLAFLAVAAFQVNAQTLSTTGKTWIDVSTSGVDPTGPYPENKTDLDKWLNYDGTAWGLKTGEKIGEKTNRMVLQTIDGTTLRSQYFLSNVAADGTTTKFTLPYAAEGKTYDDFEIVQFFDGLTPGISPSTGDWVRTPQFIEPTGIEGYLTPAHQPNPNTDSSETQLFVVLNKTTNKFEIQPLSKFAEYVPVTPPFEVGVGGQVNFNAAIAGNTYYKVADAWLNANIAACPLTAQRYADGDSIYAQFVSDVAGPPRIVTFNFCYFDVNTGAFVQIGTEYVDLTVSSSADADAFVASGDRATAISQAATIVPAHYEWIPGTIYTPVYVKTTPIAGRWAIENDFVDCSLLSLLDGTTQLTATNSADETKKVFAVEWADAILAADLDANLAPETGRDSNRDIQVFTLSAPASNCEVLSVANTGYEASLGDFSTFGLRFELREYGKEWVYTFKADGSVNTKTLGDIAGTGHYATPDLIPTVYKQQFAIWINEDGEYELYPRAAYTYKAGAAINNNVSPATVPVGIINDALEYNINPTDRVSTTLYTYNHFKMAWFTGMSETGVPGEGARFAVSPINLNAAIYKNVYKELSAFVRTCIGTEVVKDIEDYWYFIEASNPIFGTYFGTTPAATAAGAKAAAPQGWVVAMENGQALLVPKEVVDEGNPSDGYWKATADYEYVRMTAHWRFRIQTDNTVIATNMLGDVLTISGATNFNAYTYEESALGDINSALASKGGGFYLSAGLGHVVNGAWGPGPIDLNNAVSTSIESSHAHADPQYSVTNSNLYLDPTACSSLEFKLSEIYYVPTYGLLDAYDDGVERGLTGYDYTGKQEIDNDVINTHDPDYVDLYMERDHLTAYAYIRGGYKIQELTAASGNGLFMTIIPNTVLTDAATNPTVASLTANVPEADAPSFEFIPYENVRGALMDSHLNLTNGMVAGDIRPEHEKWFIIASEGTYLSYDSINTAAIDPKFRHGMTFNATNIYNATPVRFVQPLARDKKDGNWIMEFIPAEYEYRNDGTRETRNGHTGATGYNSTDLHFATLGGQSGFLYATLDYNEATRLRARKGIEPLPCGCYDELVFPDYMVENRLLVLPVKAYDSAVDGIIDGGLGMAKEEGTDHIVLLNEGVLDLSHQLAGYIVNGDYYTLQFTSSTTPTIHGHQAANPFEFTQGTGYSADTIPVYYVANRVNASTYHYLTVTDATDASNAGSSQTRQPDITDTKLTFAAKYSHANANAINTTYYQPALQLFVIAEECTADDDDESRVKGVHDDLSRYIYYPLGSYTMNYNTQTAVADANGNKIIAYNTEITKVRTENCSAKQVPDFNDSFRIGFRTKNSAETTPYLVVKGSVNSANGTGTADLPVEFRWTQPDPIMPPCDVFAIAQYSMRTSSTHKFLGVTADGRSYNTNTVSFDTSGEGGLLEDADYKLLNHFRYEEHADGNGWITFEQEVETMYTHATTLPTELRNGKYLVYQHDVVVGDYYSLYSFTGNYFNPYQDILENNYVFQCVEHDLPYYDLEKDGGFDWTSERLSILEAVFEDRAFYTENTSTYLISTTAGYRAGVIQVKDSAERVDKPVRMNFYPNIRRELAGHAGLHGYGEELHIIPYYNFSVTFENGDEYFLNVDPTASATNVVRYTKLTDAQKEDLLKQAEHDNWLDYDAAWLNYSFCLPYAQGETFKDNDDAVYIQAMDIAKGAGNSPQIIRIAGQSNVLDAVTYDEARENEALNYEWNIYTADYQLKEDKSTAWVFNSLDKTDNEWVRLQLVAEGTVGNEGPGVLVDATTAGYIQYVGPSGAFVNYATTTPLAESTLNFTFEGEERIGRFNKMPIWYYRISVGDQYLTDASLSGDADLQYLFNGNYYNYAYFTDKIANDPSYTVNADTDYTQSFGLWYVKPDGEEIDLENGKYQEFYVVSGADYTSNNPYPTYRFLALVNNRYVFVEEQDDALIFSFGKNEGGTWTDIEDNNTAFNAIAVQGGVKVVNAEGTVEIFTADGRKVSTINVTSAEQTIAAPQGVVIVKNGANVTKVLVK